jgi:FkbM family methyltransferase
MKKLKEILPSQFVYCDVGARAGLQSPWSDYKEFLQLISFEPDEEEFQNLVNAKGKNETVLPYALFRFPERRRLYLTKSRGCSSLYKPNEDFLQDFPDPERFSVEENVVVPCTSLDTLYRRGDIKNIDFIKIDVQGSELDVLVGGVDYMPNDILGLEVEVEFGQLYNGQPLFSDVDPFVRENFGMQLQDLRRYNWKYSESAYLKCGKGQLVFGEALYFITPETLLRICDRLTPGQALEKISKACFLSLVYGYVDYGLHILSLAEKQTRFDKKDIFIWKKLLSRIGVGRRYSGRGAHKIHAVLNFIANFFKPSHGGFASCDVHLGSRKKFGVFY